MSHLKRNWRRYLLAGAGLAASAYGGPAAGAAVSEYLPKILAALGL